MNYNAMLTTAFGEVRGVCQYLLQAYDRMDSPYTEKTDKQRFTRSIDEEVQDRLITGLQAKYPQHMFVAEEPSSMATQEIPDHSDVWVIDPIDGSNNYIHHLPGFAISLCYYYQGKAMVALVYDPLHDELYTAIRNKGALLNQHRIEISRCKALGEALCGVESRSEDSLKFISQVGSIRKFGCVSLTLCYVASHRLDLAVCQSPNIWDCAAGCLIAEEAGARLYNEKGRPYQSGDSYLYVSNKAIYEQLQ